MNISTRKTKGAPGVLEIDDSESADSNKKQKLSPGYSGKGLNFDQYKQSQSQPQPQTVYTAVPVDCSSPIRNSRQSPDKCPDSQISGISMSSQEDSQFGMSSQYSDPTVNASPTIRDYRAEQEQLHREQSQIAGWINQVKDIKAAAKTEKNEDKYRLANMTLQNLNSSTLDFNAKYGIMTDYLNPNVYSDSSETQDEEEEEEDEAGPNQAIEDEAETPDEVLTVINGLNSIYNKLINAEDKEQAKQMAKHHVTEIMNTFENALKENQAINDEDILSIIDDSKIKTTCKSGSSECSNLTILTSLILQLPEVKTKSGNKPVETAKRRENVENIMDAILSTNPAKHKFIQTHETQKLRHDNERNTDSDLQFENVWGTIADVKKKCCYICEGKLVDIPGISPEMEHKLPSIEFYTKVHNINEKYPDLLQKWQTYITVNAEKVNSLYMYINCNGKQWYQDHVRFLTPQFGKLLSPFIESNNSDSNINIFIALLKVYLMEFAYSHHVCNQVKDNDNLNTSILRTQFINKINACIDKSDRNVELNQARVKPHKVTAEKEFIRFNDNSNKIMGAHFNLINHYIQEYADLYSPGVNITSQMKLKIIMVQSIKATINYIISRQNAIMQKNQGVLSNIDANQRYIPMLNELDALKKSQDEYNAAAAGGRRRMTTFNGKYPFYSKTAYANKLADYENELNELQSNLKNGLLKSLQKQFDIHRPELSIGKPKSGVGGKKTRRIKPKSNRKPRKNRGVRRCNKTQRHRKTKKK